MAALSTMARLSAARELQHAVMAAQATASFDARAKLGRKITSLRDLLLNRRSARDVSTLDLFNPSEAVPMLADYLRQAQGFELAEREKVGAYIGKVVSYLDTIDASTGGFNSRAIGELRTAAQGFSVLAASDDFRRRVMEGFAAAGGEAYNAPVDAAQLMAKARELDGALRLQDNEAQRETNKVLAALNDEYREPLQRAAEVINAALGANDTEAYKAGRAEYDRIYAEMNARWEAVIAEGKARRAQLHDTNRAQREAALAQVAEHGRQLTAAALQASPVTQEQADTWAAAQEVSKTAIARLKKNGYDPAQLRRDMAEFYRLSGGRLARITIQSNGDRRASASGIHGHGSSFINIDSSFNKRTLFHELAHHLEADPLALAAGKGFLVKRRDDQHLYALRELTGNKGYGPREKAWKDSWFDAYVGKDYRDATEVFSMGLESFSDPLVLGERVAKDPEHFALMLGYMRTPPPPLFGAFKQVLSQYGAVEAEAKDAAEADAKQKLHELAARVQFVKQGEPPAIPDIAFGEGVPLKSGTFLGEWEGIRAYEAKLRDPLTKRVKRGVGLVYEESPGWWRVAKAFGDEDEVRFQALSLKLRKRTYGTVDTKAIAEVSEALNAAQAAR